MFTRRTLLRQYLMRPDERVNQIWLYSLAVWAQRRHIDVHGFTLMSTNYAAAVIALREFRYLYRKALNAWREKVRDVLFPPGTFVMRWLHAADVATT